MDAGKAISKMPNGRWLMRGESGEMVEAVEQTDEIGAWGTIVVADIFDCDHNHVRVRRTFENRYGCIERAQRRRAKESGQYPPDRWGAQLPGAGSGNAEFAPFPAPWSGRAMAARKHGVDSGQRICGGN